MILALREPQPERERLNASPPDVINMKQVRRHPYMASGARFFLAWDPRR